LGQSKRRATRITSSEISPPSSTSERKWPPNAILSTLAPTPKAIAAATAGARHGGGTSRAGAVIQKPEAASGFWMVAPALLAPPPWRAPAVAGALVFGAATSVLRMAFGGHFLSDVLVGGLISLLVIFVARRLLWPKGGP